MKYNHLILKILTICFLISVFSLISSCGKKEIEGYTYTNGTYKSDAPAALVIIMGNHANAMAIPQDAYNVIENSLDRVVYGGYACGIIADGTPTKFEIIEDDSFFDEDARNHTTLENKINDRKETMINQLKNMDVSADSPEVDLLAAIREAKNVFGNSQFEKIEDKQIFIIDTGISTTGDINFVDMNFLYSKPDVQTIIEQLQIYEGIGVLPDLSGITVTFIGTADGLSEVAAPQTLSTTDRHFIKNLWEEVIKACGVNADDILFESVAGWDTPNIYTEDAESEFPYVSVIPFLHDKIIDFSEISEFESSPPDAQPNLPDPPKVSVKLASETVGFQPDGVDYLNEGNTINTLRPYAEELKDFFKFFPDEKIWLVGTSAAVQKESTGSIELSLGRAETVKNTLVKEFDIPNDKLLTIGLGAKYPWFVNEYPNDVFDTEVAQANRAVWLLTTDSEQFEELKSAYDSNELLTDAMERFSLYYQ